MAATVDFSQGGQYELATEKEGVGRLLAQNGGESWVFNSAARGVMCPDRRLAAWKADPFQRVFPSGCCDYDPVFPRGIILFQEERKDT